MTTSADRDHEPQPPSDEGQALGLRIAEELANRSGGQEHERTSWWRRELAARLRDADREIDLEAGS